MRSPSLRALFVPFIVGVAVLVAGGIAFAATNTPQQPKAQGVTPKCINESKYTIQVPTDPKAKTEPKGTTNKPIPPSKVDKPGCFVKFCVPAALSTNKDAPKEVCTEKRFENDEELKNGNVDTGEGALNIFKGNVLKSLTDLSGTDKTTFATLSDQIRTLPQGIQDAFKEQLSSSITSQQSAVNDAERRLKELQGSCLTDGPECTGVQAAQQELKLKQEELEKLNNTKKTLEDPNRTPVVPPPTDPNACPPGQVRTGGECKASNNTFERGPGNSDSNNTSGPGNTQQSAGSNPLSNILSQLARALMQQQQQPQQPTCPTDPQQYQQFQQQYQQQLQQYNYQLQQYNYQQQFAQYYGGGTGLNTNTAYSQQQPPPMPPVQCKPATSGGGQCTNEPAQPTGSCAQGWQPVRNAQQCITSWQCGTGTGLAQISCQPQLADVGMKVGITFACSAGTAVGQGFNTNGQNSGSAEATVSSPGAGIATVNYGLTCTNQGATDSKQCTVTLNKPSLIFVANPKEINSGERSAIGWVTAGIESCVLSSPELSSFTSEQASSPKKNGTVQTPALTADTSFVLKCTTLAGGTRTATTTVDVR